MVKGRGALERAADRMHYAVPDDPVCRRAFTDWMKMDISLDPLRPLPESQQLMHDLMAAPVSTFPKFCA